MLPCASLSFVWWRGVVAWLGGLSVCAAPIRPRGRGGARRLHSRPLACARGCPRRRTPRGRRRKLVAALLKHASPCSPATPSTSALLKLATTAPAPRPRACAAGSDALAWLWVAVGAAAAANEAGGWVGRGKGAVGCFRACRRSCKKRGGWSLRLRIGGPCRLCGRWLPARSPYCPAFGKKSCSPSILYAAMASCPAGDTTHSTNLRASACFTWG